MQSKREDVMEADQQLCLTMNQDFACKLNLTNSDEELFQDAEAEFQQYTEEELVGSDDDEEEFEFSFAAVKQDGSPINADAIFKNGQIRPIHPLFDQSLLLDSNKKTKSVRYPLPPLRKLFVERSSGSELDPLEGVDEETYCTWNGKSLREVSPETCRKSNSTGFSKRWRFRDLVHRSSSDGKDAFVFLNPNKASSNDAVQNPKERKFVAESAAKVDDKRVKGKRVPAVPESKSQKAAPSAHEKHYVRNRAVKETDKRKSYLPYRQDLVGVGFFVNVNGMSKNLHPY